jgi:DNA-binding NtrC family response regulator
MLDNNATALLDSIDSPSRSELKRIMLVDDEADIITVIGQRFIDYGFEVYAYTDPRLALADFRANYYDVIILDIRMHWIGGFELYQEIKKIDHKSRICFFTAYLESESVFRNTIQSVDPMAAFVTKPISPIRLMEIVNNILKM